MKKLLFFFKCMRIDLFLCCIGFHKYLVDHKAIGKKIVWKNYAFKCPRCNLGIRQYPNGEYEVIK